MTGGQGRERKERTEELEGEVVCTLGCFAGELELGVIPLFVC